jgi:hypothetical protein
MKHRRLKESYVKQTAVDWLANHYRTQLNAQAIVSGVEAWIRKDSPVGSGRADGLIVAQLSDGTIYTVSMEAKSSHTWKNITVGNRPVKKLFHALILIVFILFLFTLLGFTSSDDIFPKVIIPIVTIIETGIGFKRFSANNVQYQGIDAIRQVEGYPANEKWIALSTDVYNKLMVEAQGAAFKQICINHGIGLLRVSRGKETTVLVSPKSVLGHKNTDNFLNCYARAKDIRNQLTITHDQPNVNFMPLLLDEPERSKAELSPSEVAESVLYAGDQ